MASGLGDGPEALREKMAALKKDMAPVPYGPLEEVVEWVQRHGYGLDTRAKNALHVLCEGPYGSPLTFLHIGETKETSKYAKQLGATGPGARGLKANPVFRDFTMKTHPERLSEAEEHALGSAWGRRQEGCHYIPRGREARKLRPLTTSNRDRVPKWAGEFMHLNRYREDFHDRTDVEDLYAMLEVVDEYATRITGQTP